MRDNGGISALFGHFNGVERFRERADLINLDQDGVRHALFNAFGKDFRVCHENIITNQLYLVAKLIS